MTNDLRDGVNDDPEEPNELAEKVVKAAKELGYGAKKWDKNGEMRVYLTRGEGRKAQDMGYLLIDDGVSSAGLKLNKAGVRDKMASKLGMPVR